MSREIKTDFEEVLSFFENYKADSVLKNEDACENIKKMHSVYYATLTTLSSLVHINAKVPNLSNAEILEGHQDSFWNYLEEIVSELGSTIFLTINGCYKAAKLTLRSSLENFFKLVGSINYNKIYSIKSTYEVIDKSGESVYFSGVPGKSIFDNLKNEYAKLCAAVHTANIEEMQTISSLGYFPHIDLKELSKISSLYVLLSKNYISMLSLIFKSEINLMHHRNRDIILEAIPRKIRPHILSA
ncbi:hypothetical protein [Pseudomonas oryzihabitans]|uniref:hypothetical protein n=1 Tax=Pseudomonas oryzihabitans TaxID=47885 RepID=UPI00135DCE23|nr:hypothetical protein [Pseudomonas oryzihabitans]MXS19890.1 hypothetical protein [Pseudomonas oryzihabitans]